MKQIVISIAGLYFKVIFEKNDEYSRDKFISDKDIIETLSEFTYKRKPPRIDGYLKVKVPDKFLVYINRDNRSFIEICQYKKINYVVSYYHISLSQLYYVFSYLITPLLIQKNGFYLHASACLIRNRAAVFLGKEGVGKSTLLKMLKDDHVALADDKLALRTNDNQTYLFQIPYYEKVNWINKNFKPYSIGNVYFLKQGKKLSIKKLDQKTAITHLLKHALIPEQYRNVVIENCFKFVQNHDQFYELTFRLNKAEMINYFKKTDYERF